jgi:predicted ribosome quality control (RQC) complex YloA/Tae2 family protein
MKFREINLESEKTILLGKNSKQNEELVNQFKGKENIILHTANPGSPFCVLEDLKSTVKDVKESAIYCARYSQDWRDNKTDVNVHKFIGKEVYKRKGMKEGTFGVKKYKLIKVKRQEIEKCQ